MSKSKLNKQHIKKLRNIMLAYSAERRDMIKLSGDVLHCAKRAIFALHRDNKKEADIKIAEAGKILRDLQKRYKKSMKVFEEGSYKACLEEYVEAASFHQFLFSGKISPIKGLNIDVGSYIAGICDVPGELYRYAVKAATNHDLETVKQCSEMSNEIIGELIEFNLTNYLRNKFDQAKQANRKLEQIVYEVSLRGNNTAV